MYDFILKFFPQPWHLQLDLCDYPCWKNIFDDALSNMWKELEDEVVDQKSFTKKVIFIFQTY